MVLKQIVAQMGVEAVVENLGNFARDMDSMNRLIDKFTRSGEKMERTFKPVNAIINAFGESLKRIAEFVIAGLIVRGIEKITSAVMNMVSAMITAGAEFQTLTIRLEGLLAREILDTGAVANFGDALMAAVPFAKDLFFWIQKLALQTPFDIQDVANTVTLAKSYGFTAEQAKILTTEIVNFSSGMGLSNIQMERIIINFGQMIQQGKITGMELRDLARGAFVPVNRVLDVMKENLGLTTDEYEKMRKEGTNQVMPFIEAFLEVVREDFPDAGKRASRTIQAVTGNIQDLVQGVLGFNIVKPILDVISIKMAEFLDILTTGVRGEKLIKITAQIGEALAAIVDVLFGGLPTGESIADFIIDKLDILKGKIVGIREIIERVMGGGATGRQGLTAILLLLGLPRDFVEGVDKFIDKIISIKDTILRVLESIKIGGLAGGLAEVGAPAPITSLIEGIQTTIENFKTFWDENKSVILGAIDSIIGSFLGEDGVIPTAGETILEIFTRQLVRFSEAIVENGPTITGILSDIASFIKEDFVPAFKSISKFILDNQDDIIEFLIGFKLGVSILTTALKILIPIILGIVSVLFILTTPVTLLTIMIPILVGLIVAFGRETAITLIQLGVIIITFVADAVNNFLALQKQWKQILRLIAKNLLRGAADAIGGFRRTMLEGLARMKTDFVNGIIIFINTIRALLGIASESKVFKKIGKNINESLAAGIMGAINLPKKAMDLTVSHVVSATASPLQAMPVPINRITTQNFTQNVNSNARTDETIANFRTLEALATLDTG